MHTVTVTGTGTSRVAPDSAVARVGVVGRGAGVAEAYDAMSGAATNIMLMSYLDEAQIGVNLDPAAVRDPDGFVECLRDGFAEVLKA